MNEFRQRLKDFLLMRNSAVMFVIGKDDIARMDRFDVNELNDTLERTRKDTKFVVDPAPLPGEGITIYKAGAEPKKEPEHIIDDPNGLPWTPVEKPNKLFNKGVADDRVVEAIDDNPFRPRYRKLGDQELAHHDRIKN